MIVIKKSWDMSQLFFYACTVEEQLYYPPSDVAYILDTLVYFISKTTQQAQSSSGNMLTYTYKRQTCLLKKALII